MHDPKMIDFWHFFIGGGNICYVDYQEDILVWEGYYVEPVMLEHSSGGVSAKRSPCLNVG